MFPDLPSDRGLTAAERLQLAELERLLGEDDPQLVRKFDAGHPSAPPLPRPVIAALVAVGVALVLAALAVGGPGGAAAVLLAVLLTPAVLLGLRRLRRQWETQTPPPRKPQTLP